MDNKLILFTKHSRENKYYINFLLLFSLFTFFSISSNKIIFIFYTFSEINLIINEKGDRNILSNDFYTEPSDIIVNGVSKKDSCSKSCTLEDDFNNISLIFEDEINSTENMFSGLTYIKEIDLSNFDCSKVTTMKSMFDNCVNLEEIKFGNIDTSLVENMERLFSDCKKLKSIDVSNFDTSLVTNMREMFARCEIIKSIDASSFQTSKVEDMFDIFAYNYELVSVNVSSFDTSSCTNFQGIVFRCYKLKSLDLSNFNGSLGTNFLYMFNYCESLIYLNLNSFKIKTDSQHDSFIQLSSNIKLCIEDSETQKNFFGDGSNIDCTDKCFSKDIKINLTNVECIEECGEEEFEFKNICGNECLQDN